MRVSVIIPTRDRKEILELALRALSRQSYPTKEYETLIVDDGSSDETSAKVKQLIPDLKMSVRLLTHPPRGPAAARNLAVKQARGELVLFLNDDIIASTDLIGEHAKHHHSDPGQGLAVLGRVLWSKEIKPTPFMHWLEHGGPQFKYDEINPGEISWRYFWTCNLSLKRDFLLENGLFDEDFPFAAWEDVELGYRLNNRGMRLVYNESAIGYHHHFISLESVQRKMLAHGWSAVIMGGKVPAEAKPSSLQSPHKQVIRTLDRVLLCKPNMFLLWKLAKWAEPRVSCGPLFNAVTLHYRIKGQREAELALRTTEAKN